MVSDEKRLLRVDEVARHYRVSIRAVYMWIAKGKLNVERTPGGGLRIPRKEIENRGSPQQ